MRRPATQVKLLRKLAHPHIATVQYLFFSHEPSYAAYLQLPLYTGGDLKQYLITHNPEPWRRKALLKQLCEALWHVHSHGYAHGDVKVRANAISRSFCPACSVSDSASALL